MTKTHVNQIATDLKQTSNRPPVLDHCGAICGIRVGRPCEGTLSMDFPHRKWCQQSISLHHTSKTYQPLGTGFVGTSDLTQSLDLDRKKARIYSVYFA